MLIPVAVAVLSVALGAALGLVGRGRGAPALSTFALVSALGVVLAQLLPDALAGVGLGALGVFAAAAVAPTLIEKLAARLHRGGAGEALGLELGFVALLVHKIGDGVGLGTYGGEHHADHHHFDVLLAIAAHTVPMVALVTLTFRRASGPRAAIVRAGLLALACVAGVGLPALVPVATFEAIEPWLTAAVGGLLLHVVAHDWQPRQRLVGVAGRLIDLFAVLLGIGVVMLSGHDHHGGAGVRTRMIDALYDLALDTAPALLLGLALGALLTTLGSRLPARWLRKGGSLRQAFRGAIVGAPLPICACGVLPLASSLRKRGAGPALVVAFLLATPELGIETFALTARFVGWPFAIVRLVAAVAVAMIAALIVARMAPKEEDAFDGLVVPEDEAPVGSFGRRFVAAFDELLYHVAPWTVVGLIAAAYVEAVLPAESLEGMHAYGLDLLVVTLVAVPSYVCAASATPLAAVLLMKGMSPGAVLVGLLLGPATNIATVGFMRASYGTRATVIGGVTLIGAAWAIGIALDLSPIPLATLTPESLEHTHGPVSFVAGLALALVLLRSIWLNGLRAWLGSLGEAMGLGHHAHDHAHGHWHDHGHDHDHDHDHHAHHDHDEHDEHDDHGHDDHGHHGHGSEARGDGSHDHAGRGVHSHEADDERGPAHGHD